MHELNQGCGTSTSTSPPQSCPCSCSAQTCAGSAAHFGNPAADGPQRVLACALLHHPDKGILPASRPTQHHVVRPELAAKAPEMDGFCWACGALTAAPAAGATGAVCTMPAPPAALTLRGSSACESAASSTSPRPRLCLLPTALLGVIAPDLCCCAAAALVRALTCCSMMSSCQSSHSRRMSSSLPATANLGR